MTVKVIVAGEYNDQNLRSVKRAAGELHIGRAWYEAALVKDGLAEYPGVATSDAIGQGDKTVHDEQSGPRLLPVDLIAELRREIALAFGLPPLVIESASTDTTEKKRADNSEKDVIEAEPVSTETVENQDVAADDSAPLNETTPEEIAIPEDVVDEAQVEKIISRRSRGKKSNPFVAS